MKYLLLLICWIISTTLFAQTNVEKGFKSVNGVELTYQIQGSGDPLIVLHGGPGMDGSYFFPGIDKLGKLYRLISYNQRGSGRSPGDLDTLMLTADQFVEDLEGFRKAMSLDKINIMGHSWGGLLAMKYALRYPEHLNSMILVSTAGADATAGEEMQSVMMQRLSPEDQKNYFQMLSDGYLNSKDGIIALSKIHWKPYVFNAAHISLIKDAYTEDMPLIQHHINKSLTGYDLHEQLSELEIPTLLIHGDYDPIPMASVNKIHHAIDGSQMVVIKDCGHFPFIEQPKRFIEAITSFSSKQAP